MFGSLGFTEIAFILILALLLFGPKRLPEIGRTIGKGMAEFRRASNDLRRTLESEVALDEVQEKRRTVAEAARPKPVPRDEPREGEPEERATDPVERPFDSAGEAPAEPASGPAGEPPPAAGGDSPARDDERAG